MPYYELAESEGTVARANDQVDLAEHALALARQGLSSPRDGLRLVAARMNQGDEERVAFYQKGVRIAFRQLAESLRARQAPL
jgi:hypothetical protein